MEINRPDTVAEVTAVFAEYERALGDNDVATLDRLFWASPDVVRYGAGECLYGQEEILAFRKTRPSVGLMRRVTRTVITTFGDAMATTNIEFVRDGMAKVGRQSQTWVRTAEGWRVVSAHVSLINLPVED